MSETTETTEKAAGVTYWRKRPVVIPGVPWDGANGEQVLAFTSNEDGRPRACIQNGSLAVWNEQEKTWLPVPVGHTVMRGALGEFYPVSPLALRETFDPAGEESGAGTELRNARRLAREALCDMGADDDMVSAWLAGKGIGEEDL